MSERKELGKIKSIKIGHGGYQDAMLGVTFELGGESWGVQDFWGFWSPAIIKHDDRCKWTEDGRLSQIGKAMIKLDAMLVAAKVDDAAKLAGKPIEVIVDGTSLKSWRLLTEVL